MSPNVDRTYNLKVTETPTEKSVARKPKKQRERFLFLVGAVVFIALAFLGIQMRSSRTRAVQPVSHDTKMEVSVVHPEKVSTTTSVELPGQTQAYTDAPIFAQTSGYLKAWYFDIGAKVKAGDVLAEIDTPEVDQELAQAQAQLKVAQSALNLSQATFQRERNLFNRKIIAAEVVVSCGRSGRRSSSSRREGGDPQNYRQPESGRYTANFWRTIRDGSSDCQSLR
jgi:multidrug efflux pump subunit AcrA (membrane-fusion protein)